MKKIVYLLGSCIVLLTHCAQPKSETETTNDYLKEQVNNRLKLMEELTDDSLKASFDAHDFDARVQNIILMSKDIENLGASVNTANQLFKDMQRHYDFNTGDFLTIHRFMHVDEIEKTVRQNELSFLNLYLLKYTQASLPMPAAR